MAKWIEILIGTADIPEEYKELISTVKTRLSGVGDYYSGWELFENGVIGHSGGTPNFSSRIVFSDEEKIGVCVLTNLNVAASTDGLCNGIYELAAGDRTGDPAAGGRTGNPAAGGEAVDSADGRDALNFPTDVWTVFDIIFSVGMVNVLPLTFKTNDTSYNTEYWLFAITYHLLIKCGSPTF